MEKDTIWKAYLSDNARYADLINGIGCGGKQIITEKDLHEKDTQTGIHKGMEFYAKGRTRQKNRSVKLRDTVRRAAFGMNFAVIGIENQEMLDYGIPLRNMNYDMGEYNRQAALIRKEIRKKSWKDSGLTDGEYFYGFRKDSRLHPVLTFILYMGAEPWDGPKSMHDIIDFTDIPFELYRLIPDYGIHLIEIRKFEDTGVFRTDVKQVFDFIRNAENKEVLKKMIEQDTSYREMEEDAYDVVACYTNADELIKKKNDHKNEGGKVNMCTAIRELIEDGRAEGKAEGRAEGKVEGVLLSGKIFRLIKKSPDLTERQIAEELKCTLEDVVNVRKMFEI